MTVRKLEETTIDARDLMTLLHLKGKRIVSIKFHDFQNLLIDDAAEVIITVEKR